MSLALKARPRKGAISRPKRDPKENPFLELVRSLEPGSDEGLEVDLSYVDALIEFPDRPDGKDSEGKPKRRKNTSDEAMDKLLAQVRRQLTEAGNAADPPVTVYWNGGEQSDDADTVTVFFKAGASKIVRGSAD